MSNARLWIGLVAHLPIYDTSPRVCRVHLMQFASTKLLLTTSSRELSYNVRESLQVPKLAPTKSLQHAGGLEKGPTKSKTVDMNR
jgi:hypothetical protein